VIAKPTVGKVGKQWFGKFHVLRDRRYAPMYVVTGASLSAVTRELSALIEKVEAGEPIEQVRTDLGE